MLTLNPVEKTPDDYSFGLIAVDRDGPVFAKEWVRFDHGKSKAITEGARHRRLSTSWKAYDQRRKVV